MKNQIPIFVINLKKDTHKKEHMINILDNLGLEYDFIDAVYGKDLDEDYISTVYDKEKSIQELGRELALGEIGCALSHKKIYEMIINQNIQFALILEDDVIINKNILGLINHTLEFPKEGECFLINYYRNMDFKKHYAFSLKGQTNIFKNYKARRFVTQPMHSTAAYIINIKGAKRLNNKLNEKIYLPIDHYTGDEKFINLYGITPRLIEIDPIIGLQSNIKPERTKKSYDYLEDNQTDNLRYFLKKLKIFTLLKLINKGKQKIQKEIEYLFFNLKESNKILKTPKKFDK